MCDIQLLKKLTWTDDIDNFTLLRPTLKYDTNKCQFEELIRFFIDVQTSNSKFKSSQSIKIVKQTKNKVLYLQKNGRKNPSLLLLVVHHQIDIFANTTAESRFHSNDFIQLRVWKSLLSSKRHFGPFKEQTSVNFSLRTWRIYFIMSSLPKSKEEKIYFWTKKVFWWYFWLLIEFKRCVEQFLGLPIWGRC